MRRIVVIGAGSLGSAFSIEAARRASASRLDLGLTIIDFDQVEDRNVYSQEFLPSHVGKHKSEVMAELCNQYPGVTAEGIVGKFHLDSEFFEPDQNLLVLDAVDNIKARSDIWMYCMSRGVPCLHLGMTTSGQGLVEWTYKDYDTFSLSPTRTNTETIEKLQREQTSMAPCQLNSLRSLILNTSLAGVISAFIFFGHDPNDLLMLDERPHKEPGFCTNWYTTPYSMKLSEKETGLTNWGL